MSDGGEVVKILLIVENDALARQIQPGLSEGSRAIGVGAAVGGPPYDAIFITRFHRHPNFYDWMNRQVSHRVLDSTTGIVYL